MILLEVDPNIVKPGWTALLIVLLLAGVITLLMISMRRQMNKIEVPYRDEISDPGDGEDVESPDADAPGTGTDDRHSSHSG